MHAGNNTEPPASGKPDQQQLSVHGMVAGSGANDARHGAAWGDSSRRWRAKPDEPERSDALCHLGRHSSPGPPAGERHRWSLSSLRRAQPQNGSPRRGRQCQGTGFTKSRWSSSLCPNTLVRQGLAVLLLVMGSSASVVLIMIRSLARLMVATRLVSLIDNRRCMSCKGFGQGNMPSCDTVCRTSNSLSL